VNVSRVVFLPVRFTSTRHIRLTGGGEKYERCLETPKSSDDTPGVSVPHDAADECH